MGLIKITIDKSDFDLKIHALRSGMEEAGPFVIQETTDVLYNELQAITPVRTGKLRDSEMKQVFGLRGEVSTNSGYGLFVDVDTKPHVIEGNPFLRIELAHKTIYVRRVFHPGTKGQKLRERTLKNSRNQVKEILSRAFLRMFD